MTPSGGDTRVMVPKPHGARRVHGGMRVPGADVGKRRRIANDMAEDPELRSLKWSSTPSSWVALARLARLRHSRHPTVAQLKTYRIHLDHVCELHPRL